jgi:zinc transport system substrate-binding protein
VPLVALGVAALALGACSSGGGSGGSGDAGGSGEGVAVLASFYPLQYVTEQVGGDLVSVDSLTPPGAEPHDLELSPAQVDQVGRADLVVYLSGFQAAVDDAVAANPPAHAVDAAQDTELHAAGGAHADDAHAGDEHGADEHGADEHATHDDAADEHADDAHGADAHTEGEHAADAHADEHATDAHDHGSLDPHFWLDPTRLPAVAEDVADRLSEIDPDNAGTYAANAAAFADEMAALDARYTEGLATCDTRSIVTTHEAFSYLAERYDLEQVGIAGVDPEGEPSPARLAEVGDIVRAEGVGTIFFETLASPKVAETLAEELGVDTAVLDPLEGLTDDSQDYVSVADANLETLRTALGCA